jgi:hypothetical protein
LEAYSAQLISVDSHTGKEYQELEPVELIRNQRTGLKHWYKLYREETPDGQVKYFTSTEHIIEGQGLRAWEKFNSHYPHPPKLIQPPSQEECFLSEGLRQITSTSGSQPLTPEGPTGTLTAIAQAIIQPTVDLMPVTQTAPTP